MSGDITILQGELDSIHAALQAGAEDALADQRGADQEWKLDNTALLCERGEESCFHGKAKLLSDFTSVSMAVQRLNEDSKLCPEGFSVVYSTTHSKYFVVYQLDKKAEVFRLFDLQANYDLQVLR